MQSCRSIWLGFSVFCTRRLILFDSYYFTLRKSKWSVYSNHNKVWSTLHCSQQIINPNPKFASLLTILYRIPSLSDTWAETYHYSLPFLSPDYEVDYVGMLPLGKQAFERRERKLIEFKSASSICWATAGNGKEISKRTHTQNIWSNKRCALNHDLYSHIFCLMYVNSNTAVPSW